MLIDGSVTMVSFCLIFALLVFAASILIPISGYIRKRWKGLAIGCLMQPVVIVVVCGLVFSGIVAYEVYTVRRQAQSAMVSVKTVEQGPNGTDTLLWYLKADEECLVKSEGRRQRYDVIRLDSVAAGVSVEDRIVVRFDLDNQQVTATDYDAPVEVVNVNWDKVKAFFGNVSNGKP